MRAVSSQLCSHKSVVSEPCGISQPPARSVKGTEGTCVKDVSCLSLRSGRCVSAYIAARPVGISAKWIQAPLQAPGAGSEILSSLALLELYFEIIIHIFSCSQRSIQDRNLQRARAVTAFAGQLCQ